MQKTAVDLVIQPRWIIPIIPRGAILENMSVIIKDGRIVDILPEEVKLCSTLYS